MNGPLSRFRISDRGATAIEYGLIAGGIAVAIAGAVFVLGDSVDDLFGSVSEVVAPAEDAPDAAPDAAEPPRRPVRDRGNAVEL